MNKSMLTGTVLGIAVATTVGAIAGYRMLSGPEFAEVLAVTPVTESVKTPREECKDVAVTRKQPVKDQHKITGSVLGAVVGGIAGNKVQGHMQENDTYQTTERRCNTVTDVSERTAGYDVQYRLGDESGTVRMDYDPGSVIPVKDGQLVLSRAAAAAQPAAESR